MSHWAEILLLQVLAASRDAGLLALIVGGILWLSNAKLAPAWRHALWLLVAVRLLMPMLPTSVLSWQSWLPEKGLPEPPVLAVAPVGIVDPNAVSPVQSPTSVPMFSPDRAVALPVAGDVPASPKWEGRKVALGIKFAETAAAAWLVGVLLCLVAVLALMVRFQRRVRRLLVRDHFRQQEIEDQLANLCVVQNISRVPQVVITRAVLAPALTGIRRRSILLSPTVLEQLDEAQLRMVLLHELAHLRRLDLWTGWVLCLLQALHWFNPLVWWAFHRTRVEAERAADAWVLKRCGQDQRKDYGEMLLQLLESETPQLRVFPAGVGVLESRRDLKTRLAAIGRFRAGRRRLAAVGAVVLMAVLAVVGLTQAPTPDEKAAKSDKAKIENPAKATKQVTVKVVERISEKPIGGALVSLKQTPPKSDDAAFWELATDAAGVALFEVPAGVTQLRAEVRRKGFTSYFTGIKPPKEFIFRLDPTAEIGGKVVDGEGEPIAGAKIEVTWWLEQNDVPREDYQWGIDEPEKPVVTDEQGKWTYASAPAKFGIGSGQYGVNPASLMMLRAKISHPRYQATELLDKTGGDEVVRALLGRSTEVVLRDSYAVRGSVVDADGQALDGVAIRELLAFDSVGKTATSEESGEFSLYLAPGTHRLLFSAEGRTAVVRTITVGGQRDDTDIGKVELAVGGPLRIRVFDEASKPVHGAYFAANLPGAGQNTSPSILIYFETDKNGEGVWPSPLPISEWTYTSYRSGRMSVRDAKPKPEGELLTVTLSPAITVSGKITDASTGDPIRKFRVVRGQRLDDGATFWHRDSPPIVDEKGSYRYQISDEGEPCFQIEAEDYVSAASRDFSAAIDGTSVELDFVLVPLAEFPATRVLLPDGKTPAAQATLTMLGGGGDSMFFKNLRGSPNSYPENPASVVDDQGRMRFPKSVPPHYGWITHPQGWLRVNTESLEKAKQEPLRLQAYSRVEGQLLIDGEPAPDRILEWHGSIRRPGGSEDKWDFWQIEVTSDAQGRYVADQLVPCENGYRVYLYDPVTGGRSAMPLATVKPNAQEVIVANLTFDEAGRVRMRGHFVTRDGGSLADSAFIFGNPFLGDPLGGSDFSVQLKVEDDGSFTSVQLLPGRYLLYGDFQFGEENIKLHNQAMFIPADAVERAVDGVFDIGDIRIAFPRKMAAEGAQKLPPGQVEVRVVDALSGKPVAGATLAPLGLSNIGGPTYSWNPGVEKIDPETVTTDSSGRAVVHFPPIMTREGNLFGDRTVGTVGLQVSHDDYLHETVDQRVDGTAAVIELQPGGRIEIIAELADGEAIEESGLEVLLVPGNGNPSDVLHWRWQTLGGSGERALVHEVVPPGEHLVRCFFRRDDGTLLFSDAEVIEVSLDAPTTLRPTLHLGQPFVGRFEDKVPRPVRDGWVELIVAPDDESLERLHGHLRWIERVKVQADGSFRCESLPSGKISLVAGCEGWANAIGEKDVSDAFYSTTQTADDQEGRTAEVKMKPNASCRVVVLRPDGSPLAGATVSMSPDQRIPGRGNSLFGVDNYSKAALDKLKEINAENKTRQQRLADWQALYREMGKKWRQITDENGVALIEHLPYDGSEIIFIEHPDFRVPPDESMQRWTRATVQTGKTVEVRQVMQPKPAAGDAE